MSLPRISKKESRKISNWLDANPLPRMKWGARRKGADKRAVHTNHGRERQRYEWIDIKAILLPKSDDEFDERLVTDIAESIELFDLLHPLAVRPATDAEANGKTGKQWVLVTGRYRYEAMSRLKRKTIPCYVVVGDEIHAQLVQLGEDLWRKTLSVLRHAEKTAEYFNLASAKVNFSGQVVQKSKVGRPPGGIALAARELPLVGRSEGARRRIIERAVKIAQITPEAKKAVIEAHLDNNQRALLRVGEARGTKAQLKTVVELAKKPNVPLSSAVEQQAKRNGVSKATAVQRSVHESDVAPSEGSADDTAGEEMGGFRPNEKRTTFDEMMALWNSECRALWAYLPSVDRERVIEVLRRAKRRSRVDIVQFLKDVFRGRQKLSKRNLFGVGAAHGFASRTIREALRGLGYQSKREGHGRGATWFAINPDRDWERDLPDFTDAQLEAFGDAQPQSEDTRAPKTGLNKWDKNYFDDLD